MAIFYDSANCQIKVLAKFFRYTVYTHCAFCHSHYFPLHPGIVFYYILLQLALWWFFHVLALFWKIKFPLHAKTAESAHLIRYVHLAMVVLGLILPLVPVIATLATSGFELYRFPAILCIGTNGNASFYALVLPIMLLLQVGVTLLVVIFYTIHKVCLNCVLLCTFNPLCTSQLFSRARET